PQAVFHEIPPLQALHGILLVSGLNAFKLPFPRLRPEDPEPPGLSLSSREAIAGFNLLIPCRLPAFQVMGALA
ncbi:MAG: hypothetical protein WHT07_01200, partial [Desulfobaccales bacterium]